MMLRSTANPVIMYNHTIAIISIINVTSTP